MNLAIHFVNGSVAQSDRRSAVRDHGPVRRAATIDPIELVQSDAPVVWATQTKFGKGPRAAWSSL
eukprot:14274390-Heterocapsa_arctica.AAC.1